MYIGMDLISSKTASSMLIILATIWVWTACSSGDDDDDVSDGLAPEEFIDQYEQIAAEAYCGAIFASCENAEMHRHWELPASRVTNLAECIESPSMRYWLGSDVAAIGGLLERDRAQFDAAAASNCLAALQSRHDEDRCWSTRMGVPERCQNVLRGTVADGEDCLHHGVCGSGFCMPGSGQNGSAQCSGICSRSHLSIGEGDRCDEDSQKAACNYHPGLTCQPAIDDSGRICVPIGSRHEQEPCEGRLSCGDGLGCHFNSCSSIHPGDVEDNCGLLHELNPCMPELGCRYIGGTPTCSELMAAGDECESHDHCVIDHQCEDGTCQPLRQAGDECYVSTECGAGLRCHNEQTGEEDRDFPICDEDRTVFELCQVGGAR